MTARSSTGPVVVVSADWSKEVRKRAVWVADVTARRIEPAAGGGWTLDRLLGLAAKLSDRGPVLVAVDLALGVPAGYWSALGGARGSSFLDWLAARDPASSFFEPVTAAADWRIERPFFRVPAGRGGLRSFGDAVAGGLLRRIDRATGAKPLFAVSGIPGTVGSATRAFWLALIPHLAGERGFAVWPFDGPLEALLGSSPIVLAEGYPGIAYAAALADELPGRRLLVGKARRNQRKAACDRLAGAAWVRAHGVDLGDLGPVRRNEDAFDAHLTAAALLRCCLEGRPLADPAWIDGVAEGGMLLAGPVDPERPARRLVVGPRSS